ncbi:MAG: type II toxin-antitoxin system YafQ family toxin [Endomicrobium sp.]|jgi:mRNA interferase YafQ|nr:type II toxin-antitoxin system YafQ family toxin [Endomicrobium sp.]
MLIPHYSNKFKKDFAVAKKRGLDISLLTDILTKLINEESLPPKNKDHNLSGNYAEFRECHIKPDWLLIYCIKNKNIVFAQTGSHSDLF